MDKERLIYKEKVKMLININHELRTPLTLIYSPLKQLLNSRQLPLSLKEKIQRIFKQSIQMKNVINMILNMRKMEMGQDILNIRPVQLATWIASLIDDFKTELEERNIILNTYIEKEIDIVDLDTLQCEIVINNLIMVSYKYSESGSMIMLSCQLDKDKENVTISIANNSYILKQEELESLFDRFNNNKKGIDNGIGLSYAKQIIEMHDGTIKAESDESNGTTLSFTLPVNNKSRRIISTERQYINDTLPNYEKSSSCESVEYNVYDSVIIVESNHDLCHYLIENMSDLFHNVYYTNNGNEAYIRMLSNPPQLVISDVDIQNMNGYELCAKIKSNKNLNYIPVVLLTNTNLELEREEHLKLGADAYFPKPFDIDILRVQIQNILFNYNIVKRHYSSTGSSSLLIRKNIDDNKKEELVLKLNKIIEDNISDPSLSVEMIASIMGMSRASLYNKLKDIIPNGINDYIIDKKINIACLLLCENELSISDIAEKVGFTQSRNFSTMFKNKMNVTPSEYRKQGAISTKE